MERTIKGIRKVYSVTKEGEVWYSNDGVRRRLNTYVNEKGYEQVHVYREDGTSLTTTVHRLVALAFLDIEEGKYQVNHKDLNKLNNHVSNLEWVSQQENMAHAVANDVFTVYRKVYQYSVDFRLLNIYESVTEAICYNEDLTYNDLAKCLSDNAPNMYAKGYFWFDEMLTEVPKRSKHSRSFMPIEVYQEEVLIGTFEGLEDLMSSFPCFTSKGSLATCLSKGKPYKGYKLRRVEVPSAVVNEMTTHHRNA